MRKIILFLALAITLLFTACSEKETSIKQETEVEITAQEVIKPKEISNDGIVNISVESAGSKYLTIIDDFGWFLFDKEQEKIVGAIDLKNYGLSQTQGDEAVSALFGEDKMASYFYKNLDQDIYKYRINEGIVQKAKKDEVEPLLEKIKNRQNTENSVEGEAIIPDINPSNMKFKDRDGKEYQPLKDYNPDSF